MALEGDNPSSGTWQRVLCIHFFAKLWRSSHRESITHPFRSKFLQAVDPHSSKVFHSLANFDIAGLFLGSRVGSDEGITGATTIHRAVLGVRRVPVFL